MTKQTQHCVHRQATGHITSAQRAASFEHARAEPATSSERGHERSRSGVDSAGPSRSSSSSAHHSLRLIEAASALDDAQRAALSASLAAHRARLAGTTHDLTGPGALDRKIDALRTLSAHLAAIQANVSVNQNARSYMCLSFSSSVTLLSPTRNVLVNVPAAQMRNSLAFPTMTTSQQIDRLEARCRGEIFRQEHVLVQAELHRTFVRCAAPPNLVLSQSGCETNTCTFRSCAL